MRMFRFALVLAAGAAMQFAPLSQPASAADLGGGYKDTPYVVVPWQGLYFGAHAGGVSSNTGATDTFTYVGDPTLNGSSSSTGLIGGAQAGYNVQSGHFVFGAEGDIGYLGISGSKSATHTGTNKDCNPYGYSADYCTISGTYSNSGGLYGDITGRIGYATDRVLVYAKGGVAFLNDDFKATYSGHNCSYVYDCGGQGAVPSMFNFGHSETLTGWTLGAGAEYALNPSWSLKAEYQHFDFGKMSYSYGGSTPVPTVPASWGWNSHLNGKTDVSVTADAVSLGVNYHVGN